MKKFVFSLLAVMLFATSPALADGHGMNGRDKGGPEGKIPLYALARVNGLSTLADAIEIAGLVKTVNTGGPFTVFAPTNEAFAALPAETLESLLNDPAALADVLLYHVVPGRLLAEDVVASNELPTALGPVLTVDTSDGVKINGIEVLQTDVLGKNGVVHVIDGVLVPMEAMSLERSGTADEASSFGEVKADFQR